MMGSAPWWLSVVVMAPLPCSILSMPLTAMIPAPKMPGTPWASGDAQLVKT